MSDAAELKALVKKLQGSSQDLDVISILTTLKNNFEVNEAILRESKAGLAVGKLRSHSSRPISDLAKEIVKKWKGAVEKAKLSNGNTSGNGKERKNSVASTPGTPLTPNGSASKLEIRTAVIDGVKGTSGDTTRDKCMTLIYDALAHDSGAPIELIHKRAQAIETAVYTNFGGTTTEYKSKLRSLFVNLKDKNNPALRESIVSGEVSADTFSKMTSQDMASQERKAADQKIKEENFHKSLAAEEQQAETDAFQCSRCKQRKCRYRQAQTRSADEPMTTFVTCVNCNNRWKFS